jgi:murein DD-endopeptidase MepM/ murein hydrolase activator NlpD
MVAPAPPSANQIAQLTQSAAQGKTTTYTGTVQSGSSTQSSSSSGTSSGSSGSSSKSSGLTGTQSNILSWLSGHWSALIALVDTYGGDLINLVKIGIPAFMETITNAVNLLGASVVNAGNVLANYLTDFSNWVNTKFVDFNNWFGQQLSDLNKDIVSGGADVKDWTQGKLNDIYAWEKQTVADIKTDAAADYSRLRINMDALGTNLTKDIQTAKDAVTDWVTDQLAALKKDIDATTGTIADFANTIDAKLAAVLGSIFLNFGPLVWGAIEIYVYAWLEWWLATMLYPGYGDLPKKPVMPSYSPNTGIPGGGGGGDGTTQFIWPLTKHYVSGYTFGPNHPGVDLGLSTGDPVVATAAGQVEYAGWNDQGFGFMVQIDHADGWVSLYGHLETTLVLIGQPVAQGQLIGLGDSTGNSTGPHLHFAIRHGSTWIDPLSLLPAA